MPVATLTMSDDTTRSQIVEQLLLQYRKANTAAERIAEANLDLVLFGGMLAQIETEIASFGGPRAGRGAQGLKAWLAEHAKEIEYRRASELKLLAQKIAAEYSLEVGQLRGLLMANDTADLPTGASAKRKQILEVLGAGSIHRLHMQFGSRKHGGARTPAPKPELTPADVRKLRMEELGTHIRTLQEMLFSQEDTLMWLEPTDLTQLADNLQGLTDQCRRSAGSMQAADSKASTRRVR